MARWIGASNGFPFEIAAHAIEQKTSGRILADMRRNTKDISVASWHRARSSPPLFHVKHATSATKRDLPRAAPAAAIFRNGALERISERTPTSGYNRAQQRAYLTEKQGRKATDLTMFLIHGSGVTELQNCSKCVQQSPPPSMAEGFSFAAVATAYRSTAGQ